MYSEEGAPVLPSSRTPKSSFTSKLRLTKNNASQTHQRQQQHRQTQQLRQQQNPIRPQRYLSSGEIRPSAPIALTFASHLHNNTAGPSQHPSQYPLSAINALQEAGLVLPSTKPKFGAPYLSLEATTPVQPNNSSVSRPTSFDLSSSGGAYPTHPLISRRISAQTPTTSERPTSFCSTSSSEFSLSAALNGEEEGMQRSQKPALRELSANAIVDVSQQAASEHSFAPSSQYSEVSEAGDVALYSLASAVESQDQKPKTSKTSPLQRQKKMGTRGRSKTNLGKVLKRGQPEEMAQHGSSPTSSDGGEENNDRPRRLRTINLACQTVSQKSPPPPLQPRRQKPAFPPSPMTPRQLTKPKRRSLISPKFLSTPQQCASVSLSAAKSPQLGVIRPPRSVRRSPSPLQIQRSEPANDAYRIKATQDDEEPIFDLVDGIRWEMLKKNDIARRLEAKDCSHSGADNDKRKSIEHWRSQARPQSEEETLHGQREEWEDEMWIDTVKLSKMDKSSAHDTAPPTIAPLSTIQSDLSLATAQSFQSMSSMGRSVFTALADSPNLSSKPGSNCPSTSPDTAIFTPLTTPNWSSGLSPRLESAPSDLPGTFPGFQSSQSLRFRPSESPSIRMTREASTSNYQLAASAIVKSPNGTVFSDPSSEAFESADEGRGNDTSPMYSLSRDPSPRIKLSQQYKAQRRASRLFGLTETSMAKGDLLMEDGEIRGQTNFSLTVTQLMALSEEAESGLLDPAELRKRHDHMLTTDDDTYRENDQTFNNVPTPDLWRQSQTSREEDSLKTPNSGSWEATGEKMENRAEGSIGKELNEALFGGGVNVELTDPSTRLPHRSEVPIAIPHRPNARRKSKRMSAVRATEEETLTKPVTATFVKLLEIPVQLVEAPVQISWRSNLTAHEHEEFAGTFGSKEMHRQEVIEELSITEWNFVSNLSSILRVFSMPLRNNDLSFTKDVPLEVARLFNWLDDILAFHVKLLKSLDKVKQRHPSALVVSIAGAIRKHIGGLSIHQSYLVNFERVTKLIDDVRRSESKGSLAEFDRIIERQSRLPECRGMGLSSFLLKPVQRLMKYPLFFKQLAELTPVDHPDHQETQQLCTMTEKIIRDMNCVKAREEDYQELKILESRIKGLPEDFHLASRQRHLFKQGSLRSLPLSESERNAAYNPFDRSFACASPTPSSLQSRPMGLGTSQIGADFSQSPRNAPTAFPSTANGLCQSPAMFNYDGSPSLSDVSCSGTLADSKAPSFYSVMSSGTITSVSSEQKRSNTPLQPPLRPASRKQSMANLFARSHTQAKHTGNEGEEETIMFAFVFDDLLVLTTMDRDEERETVKSLGKQSRNKKKQGSQNIQASPSQSQVEDQTKYTVIPKGGLSRILGVQSRATKGLQANVLEVEVLPLNLSGEGGLRSSGSTGSMTFLFNFAEEGGGKGSAALGQELCLLWEKAMERSFLSCIQARKKQSKHVQPDLSSPIFGVIHRGNQQPSLNTAQADWPRRQDHVTKVVMNAARCGDRTTLTALLQAGLPFPRSPSQQNLSDLANRTVAMVETTSSSFPSSTEPDERAEVVPPPIEKSPSEYQIQTPSMKRSPILGPAWCSLNVNNVARVGDLGTTAAAVRILDDERREEKTWWSLRMKEIEAEGEWNDVLEKSIASRRSRVEQPAESLQVLNQPTLATRVRKGLPVLKPSN